MKHDITLKEFELIYRIVSSVGEKLSHGAGRSCQFYNVTGALILNDVFKVKARPVMGGAFIVITEQRDALAYAAEEEGGFYSSQDAFHCWIETENNFLDFTSPEYQKSAAEIKNPIPRKMFQKPKSVMAESPDALSKIGEYFFCENVELTNFLLRRMYAIPAARDLAGICIEWMKRSKKKIVSDFEIKNDLHEVTRISIRKGGLVGAW